MKLVYTNPNPSGAYPPIQEGNFSSVPEGMAVWPDDVPTDVFYAHNGFVTLSLAAQEIVTGQEEVSLPTEEGEEPVVQLRDVTSTISVVTACQPNLEAWEAWKEEQAAQVPGEPDQPEPTADDVLNVLLGVSDHE